MNVAIVMTTYFPDTDVGKRRLAYAQAAVQTLVLNLRPKPLLVIADDSGDSSIAMVGIDILCKLYVPSRYVQGPTHGVGASINRALKFLDLTWQDKAWAWIYLPDDFVLTKPMNLAQATGLLDYYDYVRLDLPHPNIGCTTKFEQGRGWWLELNYYKGGFVFGTRPTLISNKVHKRVGSFKEYANSYGVEKDYSERVASYNLKGALVCELGLAWQHIASDEDEVGLNDKFDDSR